MVSMIHNVYISTDECVSRWTGFEPMLRAVEAVFNGIGIAVKLTLSETFTNNGLDVSSGDAQTIYDKWKKISQLRREKFLTPDVILLVSPYYRSSTHTAGRQYEFGNRYQELFVNAGAPLTTFHDGGYYPTGIQALMLRQVICHELGHAFGAGHDGWDDADGNAVNMSTGEKTIMFGNMWRIHDESEIVFSEKSIKEMSAYEGGNDMTNKMYRLPFNREDVSYIGNYFNHGAHPQNIKPDEYIRDGVSCVTGDGDDNKQTYWRGDYAHDGTDFHMPIGSPIYAPCDGYITGIGEGGSAGVHCELRSDDAVGYRLYSRFLHLSKLLVMAHDYIHAGGLLGYSGDTGACGDPHLHLSIGTSSGSGSIDPLTDERFKPWLQGLPFAPRNRHEAPHFLPFASNSPELKLNGKFQQCAWNGSEYEYSFKCSEPILRLLNVSKHTVRLDETQKWTGSPHPVWQDIDDYDLITLLGDKGALDGDKFACTVEQNTAPGWYYFQAVTGKGNSNPVRILVKERVIL